MKNIAKILCPVDFSEPSHAALDSAVDLAERYSSELILFHAISQIDPTPTPSYTMTNHLMDQVHLFLQQMREHAHEALKGLSDSHIAGRVASRQLVKIGDPATSIVNAAKEEKVDLIVIATHGRSGIKGFFFGSVAEKVVRTAECPVLTTRLRSG